MRLAPLTTGKLPLQTWELELGKGSPGLAHGQAPVRLIGFPCFNLVKSTYSIYLFDLLRCPELKDCKLWLHGFDISGDQFPHSTWLPSNITFSISDASRDPDEQFKGKFDVVNIRLFALVVADGDPTAIIRHAKSLLSTHRLTCCPCLDNECSRGH